MTETTLYLTDLLDRAQVEAPSASHVQLQNFVIDRVNRATVFQHPASRVVWPKLALTDGARLEVHLGVKPYVWERISSPVTFTITVRDSSGREVLVFEQKVDVRQRAADRAWLPVQVSLERWCGSTVQLVFETRGEKGDASYGWLGWGDPRVLMQPGAPKQVKTAKPGRKPDVFIITCDALRADHLGCYGAPPDRTPCIDRLAADGVVVKHARAQSDATLASYTTLLTGCLPHETKVNAEWGEFPLHLPSLPAALAGAGYRTIFAASEDELDAPEVGIRNAFSESIPCIGNPAQLSSVTARRLIDRLEQVDADESVMVWLQFFEPHPPAMPEAQFAQRFYQGDPTQEHHGDWIERIHGVESSLDLATSRPSLQSGIVPTMLLLRLHDTARALRGELAKGPDLSSHIEALGEQAWNGMDRASFVNWLTEEVRLTTEQKGRCSEDLSAWLQTMEGLLRDSERDLLTWLDGVRDYRYPCQLYASAVASVDHYTGLVCDCLKRLGRYDDALILFLSPHGEVLNLPPLHFEHHYLIEEVLRVPLIIKPPANAQIQPGAVIEGPVELSDLGATVLDLTGIPGIGAFDPKYSCRSWLAGATPQEIKDCAAISVQAVTSCLVRGDFKLVRFHFNGVFWPLFPPDTVLPESRLLLFQGGEHMDEARDVSASHPQLVEELAVELERRVPLSSCMPKPIKTTRFCSTAPKTGGNTQGGNTNGEDFRTLSERLSHHAGQARKSARKEIERLQRDQQQLVRLLDQMKEGVAKLYTTRRWRLTRWMRKLGFNHGKRGFRPLDEVMERYASWKHNAGKGGRKSLAEVQAYADWVQALRPNPEQVHEMLSAIAVQTNKPRFGLVVHVAEESKAAHVLESVTSVCQQQYQDWQLFLLGVPEALQAKLPQDHRIKHVPAGSDVWPEEVTHVAALGVGDLLESHALLVMAQAITDAAQPASLLYCDEDELTGKAELGNPFLKPAWSPDTLESLNYVGALALYARANLPANNAGLAAFHPQRAYDTVLQATEQPGFIVERVPKLLYHRRRPDSETRKALQQIDLVALNQALERRREPARAELAKHGLFHVRRAIYKRERVAILIPTRDRLALLQRCVESLVARTFYENYEIIIIDNDSRDPYTLDWLERCGHRVFRFSGPFNYAAMHNAAIATVEAPWLLFLNNDTEIIEPHWLGAMAEHVQRPEIGAVGAKLLYPEGTIQHAGVTLGVHGRAVHAFADLPPDDVSARAQLQMVRNYSAVTAACMMMRREVFNELNGFDAERFAIAYNDVDLCVRALRAGYRNVYTPHALLKHHECASRPRRDNANEVALLAQCCFGGPGWTDPFYHPLLSHKDANFRLALK